MAAAAASDSKLATVLKRKCIMITVEDALRIAWNAARLTDAHAREPAPEEALAWFNERLRACRHTWLTGEAAVAVLSGRIKDSKP
jgi:hypothetical protein